MKVIIVENYEEASQEAAKIFINQVKEKPNSILGLATGSTPVRMYELLREDHEKNHTSYKDVKSYNLDEYFGLDASHPQSYHYFMYKNLFNGIDIKDENVHVPCGQGNIQENCDKYNKMLADKIEYYKETGEMLKNTPAQYKKEFEWLKEVDSLALANAQQNLEKAYKIKLIRK